MKPNRKLTIYPKSAFLSIQMPNEGITLVASPLVIGRKPKAVDVPFGAQIQKLGVVKDRRRQGDRRQAENLPKVHLQLIDTQPFRLSRTHFMIQRMLDGGYLVHDLGSTLGTQVNDNFIGINFRNDFATLISGENIICAGGGDTPFKFRVAIVKNE